MINLCDILKGYEGGIFYSPAYGPVELIFADKTQGIQIKTEDGYSYLLTTDGKFRAKGEMNLFPSKNQRDWNIWLEEQKSRAPKTWNDIKHCNVEVWQCISSMDYGPTEPIVKSVLALLKIHQLIDNCYGGNVTNDEWDDTDIKKWYLIPKLYYSLDGEMFDAVYAYNRSYKRAIAFHTKEQVEEFLKYPENVQLLKDYFMV